MPLVMVRPPENVLFVTVEDVTAAAAVLIVTATEPVIALLIWNPLAPLER